MAWTISALVFSAAGPLAFSSMELKDYDRRTRQLYYRRADMASLDGY
jgi:hypothetical protein